MSSGGKVETSMLSSADRFAVVMECEVDAADVSVVVDVGVVERMELMISDWLCRSAVVCCKVAA